MSSNSQSNSTTTDAGKTRLPPGMVLGPDGKPCRVCNSVKVWSEANKKLAKSNASSSSSSSKSSTTAPVAAAVAIGAATTVTLASNEPDRSHCPPDVEQLGRSTWTFLHTTAAYYPTNPTPTQKSSMLSLLQSLPHLYPCSYCANHLKENLKTYPPTEAIVSGRGQLSKWLCDRHNDVNIRLGKDVFDCSKTDERWKDGPADGSCD